MKRKKNCRQKNGVLSLQKVMVLMGMIFFVTTLFIGCDNSVLEGIADDDSFEAKLEEARIALDKGNYTRAVILLEALNAANPGNATIQQYLSNAYAGLAGLDTFNILSTIETLDDANNSGSIDMIGLVLGDSNGTLTRTQIQEKLGNLENAMNAMDGISNQNDDHKVQLGLLALAHISLTLGDVILENQGGSSVTLTEDALNSSYNESQPADFSNVSSETLNADGLTQDLGHVANAVTALDTISTQGNDLSEDFSQFQNDIDNNSDGNLSQTDLENYINSEI